MHKKPDSPYFSKGTLAYALLPTLNNFQLQTSRHTSGGRASSCSSSACVKQRTLLISSHKVENEAHCSGMPKVLQNPTATVLSVIVHIQCSRVFAATEIIYKVEPQRDTAMEGCMRYLHHKAQIECGQVQPWLEVFLPQPPSRHVRLVFWSSSQGFCYQEHALPVLLSQALTHDSASSTHNDVSLFVTVVKKGEEHSSKNTTPIWCNGTPKQIW